MNAGAIIDKLNKVSPYLGKAFSDNGSPSSSRLLALLHSFVSCAVLVYVAMKNHSLPDGTVLAGLGAFATAPYAVNRASCAWGRGNTPKPDIDVNVSNS